MRSPNKASHFCLRTKYLAYNETPTTIGKRMIDFALAVLAILMVGIAANLLANFLTK